MKQWKLCITGVCALVLLGFGGEAYAAAAQRAFLMKGTRPLGMGDAFLAVSGSDSNALFYNPASINDYEKKLHGSFLSATVDVGAKSIQFISDIQNLADDINNATTDAQKNTIFGNFTSANFGRVENYRVSMPIAMLMHRYFAVGLIVDSDNQVTLRDPSFDSFDLVSRSDSGIVMGTGWGWFDGKIQTGIAIKGLYRVFTRETITQRDVVVNNDFGDAINFEKGFGVGADVGVKLHLPDTIPTVKTLKPVLGVTYQDIGNTRFSGSGVEDKAQSVSVGLSLNPKIGPLETTIAADVRDLNHNADFITLFHAGYEVRFPKVIGTRASLRVGTNQGYLAGGFTLDWRYVKLSGATYGEERGSTSRVDESRRFVGELAFGF
jgi:hypothetical protein